MKIAVIGAPGSGKTTLSAGLFYKLKVLGMHVELVPELIKYKVYRGDQFTDDGFDIQNTLEQKAFESTFDKAKAQGVLQFVICEAPLCNGYFYSSFYGKHLETAVLKKIAIDSINDYDAILFVKRHDDSSYVNFGRKESLAQAIDLQTHIENKMKELEYKNRVLVAYQHTPLDEIISDLGLCNTTK
jgi:hypothetical protein